MAYEIQGGERFEFDAELLHALPVTVMSGNENINGIDWNVENPVLLVEGSGQLTARTVSVCYCFHERSRGRDDVVRLRQAVWHGLRWKWAVTLADMVTDDTTREIVHVGQTCLGDRCEVVMLRCRC